MTDTQTPAGPPRNALGETRQKILVRRGIIVIVVLVCIAGLVLAASKTRRGDTQLDITGQGDATPSVVELLTPADGETLVNQQSQIGIDLTTPYKATLSLNGTPIPNEQLLERPELAAFYFTPGEGKVFKVLPAGRDCVTAVITRVDGTPEQIAPVTWCFRVF